MKHQSLSKNFIYQFLYQILILGIPLILSPYLTRVLGANSLGIYTYINSISYYFIIAANLGIDFYGKRCIARSTNNKELRENFWELFYIHGIISGIVLFIYLFIVIFGIKENKNIYLINSLYVASAVFDITWLFYGIENVSNVVIKNAIIKILVCICTFSFIKNESDVWKYALITSTSFILGNIILFPQVIHNIPPIKISIKKVKVHIKPIFLFSVSIIATTLYTVFDKTLLGILTVKENVAFYEFANQIILVPQRIIGTIGAVMLPRACKLAKQGNIEEQKNNMKISLLITSFIGMGAIFGIILIAKRFAILYYGEEFAICGRIMMFLSPLIYIVGAGNVIRSQYLIPNGMDRDFNKSIVYSAAINLIISTILIPILDIYGAVVGTLIAEIFGFLYQIILAKDFFKTGIMLKTIKPFFVSGISMLVITKFITNGFLNTINTLILMVLIGAITYLVTILLYFCLFERDILEKIISYLKNKYRLFWRN